MVDAHAASVELSGVHKRLGDETLFEDLSLAIAPGKTTVIIGPSGCGKSTLLRLLNGLVVPDAGEVRIDGVPLDYSDLAPVRHRTGYVIQDGGLFPHLTAERNVTLLARHLGWSDAACAERVATLAALTRLDAPLFRRYPGELSGGQCQRVSLCRALMVDPDLLLLDEPLGALDPMVRHELQSELRELFAELGKTVVMVTHDLAEAGWFAGRIVLMHEGRIMQSGDLRALARAPANEFVERFVSAQRPLDPDA